MRKKDVLLELLGRAQAFVILDGRASGVALPEWLRADPGVVLQLAYDMPIPIPDLQITDEGISATLSFQRTPFHVRVPWHAVYAIGDGEEPAALFVESLPHDAPPAVAPSSVSGNGANVDGNGNGDGDGDAPTPRRPHLKLVK